MKTTKKTPPSAEEADRDLEIRHKPADHPSLFPESVLKCVRCHCGKPLVRSSSKNWTCWESVAKHVGLIDAFSLAVKVAEAIAAHLHGEFRLNGDRKPKDEGSAKIWSFAQSLLRLLRQWQRADDAVQWRRVRKGQ